MKHGEILPSEVLKSKYGLTIERYQPPHLEPLKVPQHLRDLVPLAARWGIADDVIRDDLHAKASRQEVLQMVHALKGRTHEINRWLDSFGSSLMPSEPESFLYMMLGLDEIMASSRWAGEVDLVGF